MKAIPATFLCLAFRGAGCASTPGTDQANADQRDEKEYATGSNIPKRNRDGPSDVKVISPAAMQDAKNRPGAPGSMGAP